MSLVFWQSTGPIIGIPLLVPPTISNKGSRDEIYCTTSEAVSHVLNLLFIVIESLLEMYPLN